MADISFFARLGNLWKGFLSLWISDIEKEHPEIAYENAINSMIEKYSKLKKATAAIIRRREEIDERYGKANEGAGPDRGRARTSPSRPTRTTWRSSSSRRRTSSSTESPSSRATSTSPRRTPTRPRRRSSRCSARSRSSRPRGTSCSPRCSRRRRASASRSSSRASRSTPRSRRSTTCASTSRTPSPRRTSARSCRTPRSTSRLAALRNQVGDVQAKQQLAELKAKQAAQQAAQGQKTHVTAARRAASTTGREGTTP